MSRQPKPNTRGGGKGRHDGSSSSSSSSSASGAGGSKGSPGSTGVTGGPPPPPLGAAAPAGAPMMFPPASAYPPSLGTALGGLPTGALGGADSGAGAGASNPLETLFNAARQLHLRGAPGAAGAPGAVPAPAGGMPSPSLLGLGPGAGPLGAGGVGVGGGEQDGGLSALQRLLALQGATGMAGAGAGAGTGAALGALLDAAGRAGVPGIGPGVLGAGSKRPFDVAMGMGGSGEQQAGGGGGAGANPVAAALLHQHPGLPSSAASFLAATAGRGGGSSGSLGGSGSGPLPPNAAAAAGAGRFHTAAAAGLLGSRPGAAPGAPTLSSAPAPATTAGPPFPTGPPPMGAPLGLGGPLGGLSGLRGPPPPQQHHAGTGTSPPSIPVMGAPLGLGVLGSLGGGPGGAGVGGPPMGHPGLGLGLHPSASGASSVRSGRSEEDGASSARAGGGGGGAGGDSDFDVSDEEDEGDEEGSGAGLDEEGNPRMGRGARARARARAQRDMLGALNPDEKVERRKERARMYSHIARKKQETNMKDLKLEMECLTVYRLMIDECPDLVAVLSADMEGRLLFANCALAKLLRSLGVKDVERQPIWALFHESHRPELMKAVRAVIMDADTPGRIRARLRSTPQPSPTQGGEGVVATEYDISLRHSQTGIICYMRPNEGPAEGEEAAEAAAAAAGLAPGGAAAAAVAAASVAATAGMGPGKA